MAADNATPLIRAFRVRRSLRAGLVQLIYVAAGLLLGLLVPHLQVGAQLPSENVVTLLTGTAAGLLTVASVVYALLFLVAQFAANSQSPRLNLFRDQPLVWHTLGVVLGILVYLLTCAIVAADEGTTPALVPASAVGLLLVVIVLGGRVQMAAFRSVQLAPVLDTITARTLAVINTLYPESGPTPDPVAPPSPVNAGIALHWLGDPGVLRQIDLARLLSLAGRADVVIRLRVRPGDFLYRADVVADLYGAADALDRAAVLGCLEMGIDRTHTQDPLFGFQLLVDIAMRAMSRINDPATAIHTIDYIETLLRSLARRNLAIGHAADDTGTTRVVFDPIDWETYVAAGTDEIVGTEMHPLVRRRLHLMLDRLTTLTPQERHPPIRHRIAALDTPPTP